MILLVLLVPGMVSKIKTTVGHVKRDYCDVYVGRPTAWGNPYMIGIHGETREEVIALYREWIQKQTRLLARLPELRGKKLGCWCHPNPCHADVLAELADAQV